jgi:hypothetical protein
MVAFSGPQSLPRSISPGLDYPYNVPGVHCTNVHMENREFTVASDKGEWFCMRPYAFG